MSIEVTTEFKVDIQQWDDNNNLVPIRGVVPTLSVVEKQKFDSEAQALRYHDDLGRWFKEFPAPFRGILPKWRIAPTEGKLLAILDEIHGPDDLWHT